MGCTAMMKAGLVAGGLMLAAAGAQAQEIPVESGVNGGSAVSLHLHPFLTAEELSMLRLVASDAQALSLFVTSGGGHAALAVAPEEGFVREGALVGSAVALGDLPDAEAARTAALAGCDGARKAVAPCVVVLEVAPLQ